MSELIKNHPDREQILKQIVEDLQDGSVEEVARAKARFDELLRDVSPEEIASMEQSLIAGGVPVEQVQKLCDVHVTVFEDALKRQKPGKTLPGHPVHTYLAENREAERLASDFKKSLKRALSGKDKDSVTCRTCFEELAKIDLHYTRKENQLFPYLERVDFTGPSKVMWGKHDEIREQIKVVRDLFSQSDRELLRKEGKELIGAIKRMIFMEEKILFPTAMRKLPEYQWAEIRKGEQEIGYAWVTPGNLWDANVVLASHHAQHDRDPVTSAPSDPAVQEQNGQEERETILPLQVGGLTLAPIDLMLTHLPLDVTFVDEQDAVRYYSQGKERIFPRSPGIIGRDVQNCHPPKSVHVVQQIVQSFKDGSKDHADFWLQMQGRFLHIRYFAVRDSQGVYKGTIEVSQDVTEIRALEGERRLLDW